MPTNPTAIGQTFFSLVSSMGDTNQEWDTTTASGAGSLAASDVDLSGTQIVMGDNDGQMVNGDVEDSVLGHGALGVIDNDDSAVNFGAGGVAANDSNVNYGSGEQYNVEDSTISESAFGHSQVQSNDINVDHVDDGSAVAFGGEAHGANVDADIWGNDGNVAVQAGEDQVQNQLNDESVDVHDSFQVNDSFNPFSHNSFDNDLFDIA